mmetsp:Transcript_4065/g.14359  ORF Transcript_4065/g.14359 Transcript_4065/m.14359 type:complete len:268 (-) Transcript_4065:509-1312(-)
MLREVKKGICSANGGGAVAAGLVECPHHNFKGKLQERLLLTQPARIVSDHEDGSTGGLGVGSQHGHELLQKVGIEGLHQAADRPQGHDDGLGDHPLPMFHVEVVEDGDVDGAEEAGGVAEEVHRPAPKRAVVLSEVLEDAQLHGHLQQLHEAEGWHHLDEFGRHFGRVRTDALEHARHHRLEELRHPQLCLGASELLEHLERRAGNQQGSGSEHVEQDDCKTAPGLAVLDHVESIGLAEGGEDPTLCCAPFLRRHSSRAGALEPLQQ